MLRLADGFKPWTRTAIAIPASRVFTTQSARRCHCQRRACPSVEAAFNGVRDFVSVWGVLARLIDRLRSFSVRVPRSSVAEVVSSMSVAPPSLFATVSAINCVQTSRHPVGAHEPRPRCPRCGGRYVDSAGFKLLQLIRAARASVAYDSVGGRTENCDFKGGVFPGQCQQFRSSRSAPQAPQSKRPRRLACPFSAFLTGFNDNAHTARHSSTTARAASDIAAHRGAAMRCVIPFQTLLALNAAIKAPGAGCAGAASRRSLCSIARNPEKRGDHWRAALR